MAHINGAAGRGEAAKCGAQRDFHEFLVQGMWHQLEGREDRDRDGDGFRPTCLLKPRGFTWGIPLLQTCSQVLFTY